MTARDSIRPQADEPGTKSDFITALAAALPRGFWSMPVVVGCSGGADSVALLLGLARLRPANSPQRLVVAHAEHDLRPTAPADREFVAALAARLGLRLECRKLAVRSPGGVRGEGLEARARRLRHDFFVAVAREIGGRSVAVAHTADDQAETILQRILRGTGVAGLTGMKAARPLCDGVALVRPLLRLPRSLGRDFLAAEGAAWREDESNADIRFARNFLRHEVLPRCAAGPFPAAAAGLVRLGRQAEAVAGALASAAEHLLDTCSGRQGDGTVVIRAGRLAGLDPHLVAEVFVALWRREGWPQRDMTGRHYARLAELVVEAARGPRPAGCDLPAGVRVEATPDGCLSLDPPRPRGPRQDLSSTRR